MLNVELFRIDDRLIHGQVMTGWTRLTGAKRIMIVDDAVAKDSFSLSLFRMASPPGVTVQALTLEEAVKELNSETATNEKVIVLFKTPKEPLWLLDKGIAIKKLNVGGMGAKAGRKKFFKNVHLSEEELNDLKSIMSRGVEVEFRMVPDDKGTSLASIVKA